MKQLLLVIAILTLSSCVSVLKDVPRDSTSGYFPTIFEAKTLKKTSFDIDSRNQSVYVEFKSNYQLDLYGGPQSKSATNYMIQQLKKLNYFKEFFDHDELQLLLIKNNLSEQIPSLESNVSISNAAKLYKPFLWLKLEIDEKLNHKLILVDPLTLEEYFIAESYPNEWGLITISDEAVKLPLFNALIDYIKSNSDTFK